jgi:hydroxypyruvate isomerase
MSRRSALTKIAGTSAVAVAATHLSHRIGAVAAAPAKKLKGRINHSVCQWCYKNIPLEELCQAAK